MIMRSINKQVLYCNIVHVSTVVNREPKNFVATSMLLEWWIHFILPFTFKMMYRIAFEIKFKNSDSLTQ